MKVERVLVFLAALLLAPAAIAQGATVHVDPAGDDRGPGTATRPMATLERALARVGTQPGGEIVLHAGVYEPVEIGTREQRKGPKRPPLLIRAARTADGGFETVRFDAGRRVRAADRVAGAAGVYRLSARWTSGDPPQMWEDDTRTRYVLVADLAAVKRYPASFTVADGAFWFHTSDGQPPERHDLGRSHARAGIVVWRSDVTLSGLEVRDAEVGIRVRGERVTVEDCRVRNARRGVSVGGNAGVVRRLRVDDSAGGVYVSADDVVVEESRLFRRHDGLLWTTYDQDETGVQFYYPSRRGLARRNLAVGFLNCVFVKSSGGARIEHNTCVHPGRGAFGVGGGWEYRETAVRNNVVVGYTWPIKLYESVRRGTIVDGNCFWEVRDEGTARRTLAHLERVAAGRDNRVADPRFAAPGDEDYRLRGNSCARRDAGAPSGAFAQRAPGTAPGPGPAVEVTLAEPARPVLFALELHALRDPRLGGAPGRLGEDRLRGWTEWQTPRSEVRLRIAAKDPDARPTRLRIRACDGSRHERAFAGEQVLALPASRPHCLLEVRAALAEGDFGEPAVLLIHQGADGPRLISGPHVRASRHGAILTLETDVPAALEVEVEAPAMRVTQTVRAWVEDPAAVADPGARRFVHQVVLSSGGRPGRHRYRLSLRDALGRERSLGWSAAVLDGPTQHLFVSPGGRDGELEGSRDRPFRTLQYALDRALPGDRIGLAPGLYPGETILTHGGSADAPIVVEATVPGAAVLDGARRVDTCLDLREAPFVTFDGLEIRWANEDMVRAERSPGLTIRNARIWGGLWFGRGRVGSIRLRESPGATVHRSVIFQTRGLLLRDSPRATLTHNTLFATVFSTVTFQRSVSGSVCRNNSLAFNGNEAFSFVVDSRGDFDAFDCDYNNLGTHLGAPKKTWLAKDPGLAERLEGRRNLPPAYGRLSGSPAKRLVRINGGQTVLYSLEEWQAWSGKDAHSLFADPRYVDVEARDFRLRPGSPNRGAGENGATIGALDVAD